MKKTNKILNHLYNQINITTYNFGIGVISGEITSLYLKIVVYDK